MKYLLGLIILFLTCSGCISHTDITPDTVPTVKITPPSIQLCPMSIYYIDVGQGDSEYLEFPNGQTLLIDTGTGKASSNDNIGRVVQKIDTLVITHDHADHTGGMGWIEQHYHTPDAYTYSNLHRGDYLHIDDTNVSVEVMNPGNLLPDEENDRSVILRVTYNQVVLQFEGDAGSKVEDKLSGHVDILKVAHHGSGTSTSSKFLKAASPDISIISVGSKNPYSHPSKDTLSRLAGISTYRTDLDGTIRVCTDGNTYSISV